MVTVGANGHFSPNRRQLKWSNVAAKGAMASSTAAWVYTDPSPIAGYPLGLSVGGLFCEQPTPAAAVSLRKHGPEPYGELQVR